MTNVYFAAGTNGNVTLYNDTLETAKYIAANAMMWAYNFAQDNPPAGAVPAWWANFYFGANVAGSSDPDGDGYSNYAEYVYGTDPTDPASHLEFSVTPGPGNTLAVTFAPCQGGRTYQLQTAPALSGASWTTLTNAYTVNTNGSATFSVNAAGPGAAYYRLSAQIAPQ